MARSQDDPNYDPNNPYDQQGGDNSPTPPQYKYGNPAFDLVGNIYQDVTGGKYTPTQADVSQWGTNIDANYQNSIRSAIGSWWNTKLDLTKVPPTPGSDNGNGIVTNPNYVNMNDPVQAFVWNEMWAKAGKTPRDQSDFQYWVDKVNQTGGLTEGNKAYWTQRALAGQGGVGDYQERPEVGGSSGGGSSSFTVNPAPPDPRMDDLIQLLTDRAHQSLNIDPRTDSIIRPQVDNYDAQQQTDRNHYLNDLAESSSPYATGAQQTAATQTAEAAGKNTANLQSTLTANELTARRTEIQNALSEMGAMLTSQQQLALQRELANLDAAIKTYQINSQNDQFLADLGFRTADRANYWDWQRSNPTSTSNG